MASLCAACGNIVAADDRFCRVCGSAVVAVPSVATANVRLTPATPAQTSGKATASLVCGLLFFIPLAFVAAIVFGHLALSEIRKSAGRLKGEGLAIAGLVLGYAWIVSIPVILIIAAIAIPNLLRARMAANESSAVAGIRQINVAEVTYPAKTPMRVSPAHSQTSPATSMVNWLAARRTDTSSDCPAARRPRLGRSSSIRWSLIPLLKIQLGHEYSVPMNRV
jgi:Domain of unknown function (DUF4190)